MAVTFDDSQFGSGYPQNLVTISGHTLGSGTDRIVLAGVCLLGPGFSGTWDTDPTYGGEVMNFLDSTTISYYGRELELLVFYLLDADLPAAGANNLTYDSGTGPYGSVACVSSYAGVQQAVPPTASDSGFSNPQFTAGTAQTTNITVGASAGWLVDFFVIESGGGTINVGTGQTDRDTGGVNPFGNLSDKSFSSSGSNSMENEPQTNYDSFSHIIVELAEPSTAPRNAMFFGMNF